MTEKRAFTNEVAWKGGYQGELCFAEGQRIDFALPEEFGGVAGFLSPEDLYVAAANACFLTTTLNRARKYGVDLEAFHSSAEGIMEPAADGRAITRISIKVRLRAKGNCQTMEKMMAEVASSAPVIRSMKTGVDVDIQVE
ncbi:MAG: hypothetical protein GKC10_04460 [Methanosarcinales archaeon]|nr:hypothetical protein [Methanosarcinales archaeon]